MRSRLNKNRFAQYGLALGVVSLFVAGCESTEHEKIPEPLHINKPAASDELTLTNPTANKRDRLMSAPGAEVPLGRGNAEPILASTPPHLTGDPVSVKFEGIRLPAFINTIFGDILKVTWEMDNSLMNKDIMVTLSTDDKPLARDSFYRLVGEVLANYGVAIVYSNNVYRIVEASSVKKPIPRIIRRSGADVPQDLRPIFYFQALNNIPVATMQIWLDLTMKDRVQAVPLPYADGMLLLGNTEDVRTASEIIQTLDQPYLAGSQSLKISPVYWSATRLAAQLIEILSAEGYSIAQGWQNQAAVKLIPVEAQNIIIAFGTGQDSLKHLLQWATDLDQPAQSASNQGAFYYQLTNAKAKDIADTIRGLTDGAASGPGGNAAVAQTNTAAAAQGAPANTAASPLGGSGRQRVMVDETRNGLIFVGTAEEFGQFRTLVQQMDRAPMQVMIEATIAEVNLKQGESLGMVFDFAKRAPDALNNTTIKSDGTGIFFTLVRDHGSLLSQINAMADYNRLQVLSAPRLVTSSGKTAAINVGTQVPIITAQESSPTGQVAGNSSILQSIQYRNTGILLNVSPTINSAHRVELTVSQEVSDAQQNNVSGVQSPLIINRSLQTTLSLDDGETALLGGMISENYSKGNSGIPYLKDIPILGNLFKNQSSSLQRTELIVLLTPYIIDSTETANQVRDAFRAKLGEWAAPTPKESTPAPKP